MSKSTRRSRSAASSRGNATRAARKSFGEMYGSSTAKVVRLIAAGLDSSAIRSVTSASRTTIAAYRANYTRGTYWPFVYTDSTGTVYGNCNYGTI